MDLQNMTLDDILKTNLTLKKTLEDLALGKNPNTGEVNPNFIYSESTYSPINACGVGEDPPEKSDHHNRQPSTYSSS